MADAMMIFNYKFFIRITFLGLSPAFKFLWNIISTYNLMKRYNKNETTSSSSQDYENAIQPSTSSNGEITSNLRQGDENEIQPSTSSNNETT
ncbi:276_t:CDS:2, partial [Dentiscutata heterogama]